jgi:hypothetical protein
VLTKGQDYAITGLLDTNGAGNISINRTNDTLLGISFAVTATNLLGAVGDGNWVADLTGEPAQIGTNSPITYLLSTETQTIGVLTTSNYLSTITAALPDGSPWSQTCGISATGQWPIYQVTAQGALIGWFQQTPTNVVGTAILAPADTSNTNQLLQITGQPQ